MFCWNCGKEIPDTSKFCPYCGSERDKVAAVAPSEAAEVGAVPAPAAQPTQPFAPPAAPAPAPAPQQPAQPAPAPAVQPFAPQPSAQPTYGQQPYSQAPGAGAAFAGTAVAGAPSAPPAKRSKLPIIIAAAAVVVVLVIGAIIVVASGLLTNLASPKSAITALYDGTENLLYETSSATVEVRAGAGITLKWEFGNDLAHSTIWGYTGGTGFVLNNDTIYVYESTRSGSDTTIIQKASGIISELNDLFYEEYGVNVDFNTIVKSGKLDRDAINKINEAVSQSDVGSELGNLGLGSNDDIDTAKITEILDAFMSTEVNKSSVYEKFMSDLKTETSGGTTSYEATFDPAAFFVALGDYAIERGKDSNYQSAADQIVEACSAADSLDEYLSDFNLKFSVKNDMLTSLSVDINTPSATVSFTVSVSDINATSLSSDATLEAILSSPVARDRDVYGGGSDYDDLLNGIF